MDHWKFYNKEKVIGKGSFGLAYLVKSTVNNRHYVIKSIELPSNSSNEVHNANLISMCRSKPWTSICKDILSFSKKSFKTFMQCVVMHFNKCQLYSSDMQGCRNLKKIRSASAVEKCAPMVEICRVNLSGGWNTNRVNWSAKNWDILTYLHTLS